MRMSLNPRVAVLHPNGPDRGRPAEPDPRSGRDRAPSRPITIIAKYLRHSTITPRIGSSRLDAEALAYRLKKPLADLVAIGCPKLNIEVRADNIGTVAFYRKLGYEVEERVSMGKRLPADSDPYFTLYSFAVLTS